MIKKKTLMWKNKNLQAKNLLSNEEFMGEEV